jgi:protocatechuate 3,4-dioxygenase beta subunit
MNIVTRFFVAIVLIAIVFSLPVAVAQQQSDKVLENARKMMQGYTPPQPTNPPETETPQQAWERLNHRNSKPVGHQPTIIQGKNKILIEQLQKSNTQFTPSELQQFTEEKIQQGELQDLRPLSNEQMMTQFKEFVNGTKVPLQKNLDVNEIRKQGDKYVEQNKHLESNKTTLTTSVLEGIIFNDLNCNALLDVGEPGVSGWTVDLLRYYQGGYISTQTDGAGIYQFTQLAADYYYPSLVIQAGWAKTFSTEGWYYLSGTDTLRNRDFGVWQIQPRSISGMKFNDVNRNGVKDPLEPGLQGWTINLYENNTSITRTTVTDTLGNYRFDSLMEYGYYQVSEQQQNGWVQTVPSGYYQPFLAGQSLTDMNFGNRVILPNHFSGMKFNDLNHNGVKDPGEPGIAGWTINVTSYYSGFSTSVITDVNGMYFVSTTPASDYYFIHEENQPGWYQTKGTYDWIYVEGIGDTLRNYDFGNWLVPLGSIRGMKFNDVNNSRTKDPGEPGISGWTIHARKLTDNSTYTTVTDANGLYFFDSLTMVSYYDVWEDQQLDWTQTYPMSYTYNLYIAGDTIPDVDFGNYLYPPTESIRVNTLPSYAVNENYGNALAGDSIAIWGNVHGGVVPLRYYLDFGDGNIDSGFVTNRRYIGKHHTYTIAGYYTMTLTVRDNLGAIDVDQSLIRVFAAPTPEIRRNMAIEKGLLYDYLNQYPDGHWYDNYGNTAATGSAVLSFEENVHLPTNNINTDIYAEYVRLGLNFLLTYVGTTTISPQAAGNPDSDGDNIGAFFSSSTYANGIAGLAIIGAHPNALSAQSDIISVGPYTGLSFYDVIVDALDEIAFSQTDIGQYGRGGWRYTASYASDGSSDNSAVQWHSLVIEAAEKLWGLSIQQFVKDELLVWLQYSQDGTGGFGYTDPGNWNNVAKTGSGIGSYAALGVLSTSAPVTNAINFLDANWASDNFGNLYAMYATKKGLTIIDNRNGVSNVGAHNWRNEYNNYLVTNQYENGSWACYSWLGGPNPLATSFGVLILTPGVSQLRPVAVIAPVSSKPPLTSFLVDGTGSHHRDPAKAIVEYLWDYDASNGVDWNVPDAVGPMPSNPGYALEGTYTITLRVKDNSEPPLYDYTTEIVTVQSTNNPPVAVPIPFARGPVYAARVGEPILLDGRDSYDPDYPADSVIAFNWDTNGNGIYGDVTTDTTTVVFMNEYNGQVGLRVYDTHNDSSTNNAYITIVASRKDIFVEQFIVNPAFGSSGDSIDFFAVFKNDDLSNVNVMNALVRFYDENPRTVGNQIGGDFFVDLPIGTRDTVSTRLKLPTLPSGPRSLYVYLDANDNVAEWNEVNNFAYYQFTVGSYASITGMKFEDVNGNGQKDVDEPGLANWLIFLDGSRFDSTITDVNGFYSFGSISPGTYMVYEDDESLWVQTLPVSPKYYTVTATLDSVYSGNDFGNFHVGTISGMKFFDMNHDSLKGELEPGLEGWTINLIGTQGTVSTLTDANGNYTFTNVGPGNYSVEEVIEPGWFQTFPKSIVYDFTMLSNSDMYGLDFGNYQSSTISGKKFNDLNGNGVKDAGEPGLANWKIVLQGAVAETTSTAVDGTYQFTITSEGTYSVNEIQQAGWVQTTPPYPPFAVVFGQNITNVDFGNYKQPKITGMKFEDLNGDGVKDQNEPGLSGWTIRATKGQATKTTLTAGNGSYTMLFDSTEIGTWTISEVLQQNWQQTFPANGTYSVNIQSGVEMNNLDFGNFLPASISGQKFNDMNGDSLTTGDPTLNGWTIQLYKGEVLVGTAVTSGSGNYSFGNLTPGNYGLTEVVQQGWVRTAPKGGAHFVTLTSGMNVTGKDFANFKLVSISGMKFHDYDGDSLKDVNESGLPNWQILLQKDGVPFDTAVTDANGNYSFTDLFAGPYTICEEVVQGWYQTKPTLPCYSETIVSGSDLTGRDFGNFEFGSIAGYKFFDHDSAGDYDSHFDDFMDSLRVVLVGTHTPAETVLTDANGQFFFNNVPADNYTVREVPRSLWRQTYPALGAPYTLTMVSGLDTNGFVFGNFYQPDTGRFRTFMRADLYKAAAAKPKGKTQIKKPNAGNIRDSVYLNRGFSWDNPLDSGYARVGIRRYDSTDCYGWFFFPYNSIREKNQRKYGYHSPSVAKYQYAKPWKKEPKTNYFRWIGEIYTSSQFANASNHLAFELLAFKLAVASSDLGHTPVGLGDLVFDRASGPDTIFNNLTLRQIIDKADTALTMGLIHCPAPAPVDTVIPIGYLITLDSVFTRLNRDFWKPLDARKFTDSISTSPLRFKGAVSLYKVPYVKRDPSRVSMLTRFAPTELQTGIPLEYLLEQNYPNPFNPSTVIRYQLSVNSTVTLKVYDMLGREVQSLADNEWMEEGEYEFEFDGSNLATGVYFYRLVANGVDDKSAQFVDVKKMLLVK